MQKITPFLWFEGRAEEAMNFYVAIFKNSKKGKVVRYGDAGPGPKGAVMTAVFQLDGQEFIALNGGAQFKFSQAVSFVADRSDRAAGAPQRSRSRSITERHEGDDADEEDRHRRPEAGQAGGSQVGDHHG